MADTKRNATAGKVATPKTATSPTSLPVDTAEALGKAIGARVKLTTVTPDSQTLEGTLYTACSILNVVAINTRNPPPTPGVDLGAYPGDYRIIPISRIQSFQVLSLDGSGKGGGSFASAQPQIGQVDMKRLRQREEEKIKKLKEDDVNRGKGVTKEAQAIFDSFKRINMPIRWHNQEMIVHDGVIIAPPYRVEDCKGAKDKQEVLIRVRRVLEGERRKLKEREDRDRDAAIPVAPRKGG